ncbi:MAG: hypothetical protein AAB968_03105, partial [Patescibacteria group bacterium]
IMENNFVTLYHSFKDIVGTGTEDQARQFLLDHINEFPEDVKNGLVLTLFEDALNEAVSQESAMIELKQEGIRTMTALEQAIRILDDKLKVLDLQEKIS